jgi:uncharacterized protein involved in exopolysaccharide biosynthesis
MTDHTDRTPTAPPARSGALLFEPRSRISSARDVAELVFRHLPFGLAVWATVMTLSIALVYLQPPVYESVAKVLIERGVRPTQRTAILEYQLDAFEAITSEMEIITSRAVAEDVVDRLRLVERPQRDTFIRRLSEGFKGMLDELGLLARLDRREALIRGLLQALRVEPAPQSAVLVVTYGAESATEAAEIANAITESYLAHHRRVFQADTGTFFKERLQQVGTELEQLRERMRRETDITSSQRMMLELGVLEKAYTFYREKLSTAEAEMAADESLVNVRIIDRPVVAARAARSRLFLLAIAFVGAVLMAVALSLVREYFDHDIYSQRDLEALGVPVLGSVSRVRGSLRPLLMTDLEPSTDLSFSPKPGVVATAAAKTPSAPSRLTGSSDPLPPRS